MKRIVPSFQQFIHTSQAKKISAQPSPCFAGFAKQRVSDHAPRFVELRIIIPVITVWRDIEALNLNPKPIKWVYRGTEGLRNLKP